MEEIAIWHNDTFKDSPNNHSQSLKMGYVDFGETYTGEDKIISHSIFYSEVDGELVHMAMYADIEFATLMSQANEDDF